MTSQKMYSLEELKELVETFYDRSDDKSALHFIVWLRGENEIKDFEPVEQQMKYKHLPPQYYGYSGEFIKVNICTECKLIGRENDIISICHNCGSDQIKHSVGRYNFKTKEWILR